MLSPELAKQDWHSLLQKVYEVARFALLQYQYLDNQGKIPKHCSPSGTMKDGASDFEEKAMHLLPMHNLKIR